MGRTARSSPALRSSGDRLRPRPRARSMVALWSSRISWGLELIIVCRAKELQKIEPKSEGVQEMRGKMADHHA